MKSNIKILVSCPMESEYEAFTEALKVLPSSKQSLFIPVLTGIGKVESLVAVFKALTQHKNITHLWDYGCAGAVNLNQTIQDSSLLGRLFVGSSVEDSDFSLVPLGYHPAEHPKLGTIFSLDISDFTSSPNLSSAHIHSADSFFDLKEQQTKLSSSTSVSPSALDLHLYTMETFALYRLSQVFNLNFSSLRVISDTPDHHYVDESIRDLLTPSTREFIASLSLR